MVTETSGNGYALYNGVKLPNIDSVWTDKETYPYAAITKLSGEYGYILTCIDQKPIALSDGNVEVQTYPWNATSYIYNEGTTWEFNKNYSGNESPSYIVDPTQSLETLVWASHDILNEDGTTYLTASDPIPLDGMTVIEWDGDTTGLEQGTVPGYQLLLVSQHTPTLQALENVCIVYNGIHLWNGDCTSFDDGKLAFLIHWDSDAVDDCTAMTSHFVVYDYATLDSDYSVGANGIWTAATGVNSLLIAYPANVYYDEFPILWTDADVADNARLTGSDGTEYFPKVSNLVAEKGGNYWFTIEQYDTTGALNMSFTAVPGTREKFDKGWILRNLAIVNTSLNYINAQIFSFESAGYSVDVGITAPEPGIYVACLYGDGEIVTIDPSVGYFRYGIYKLDTPQWNEGIAVTSDTVKNLVQHYVLEDSIKYPLAKISDAIITADDIAESGWLECSSSGWNCLYPLGNFASVEYPFHYIKDLDGVAAFRALWSLVLLSVSDTAVAAESLGVEEFPETGTYVQYAEDNAFESVFWLKGVTVDPPDEPETEAPTLDPTSMLLGWLTGERVKAMLRSKRQPVAYLYNGVRLPNIDSVWTDKDTYPYAYITQTSDGSIAFLFLSTAKLSHSQFGGTSYLYGTQDGSITGYSFFTGKNEWTQMESYNKDFVSGETAAANVNAALFWANVDVYNKAGDSLHLSASAPVPVYE